MRPDLVIEVRRDVLDEADGPMLQHGVKGFKGQTLRVPRVPGLPPNPAFLEERYELFRMGRGPTVPDPSRQAAA